MNGCPSPNQLAELLTDHLDPGERHQREVHLGGCAACQQALLRLTGDADLGCLHHDSLPPSATSHAPREDFLLRLKQALQVQAAAHQAAPSPPLAIPGFEILEEIGHGGTSVIYKALQKSLNRLVALKVIRASENLTAEDRHRLLRGVEAIARLRHPNVVQIYEVGEHDGFLFGAVEYMAGGSLDRYLHGEPWLPRKAAAFVRTLAEAVHAVHEQGIIHRDLKPANILLQGEPWPEKSTKNAKDTTKISSYTSPGSLPFASSVPFCGQFALPKIADFGLAKPIDGGQDVTVSGEILGTPSYMAPEQAAGRVREFGPATDVYALGAILYELLTGRSPFRGTSRLDTLQHVVHQEPVPPARLQPTVPRDLQTICLKCLHKEPRRRYATAGELAGDLGRFLEGMPIRARPVPLWERWARRVKRQPAVTVLLGLLVGVALLGMTAWALEWRAVKQAHRDEAQRRRAIEADLEQVEGELYSSSLALARSRLDANDAAGAQQALTRFLPERGEPDRRTKEWFDLWQRCQ